MLSDRGSFLLLLVSLNIGGLGLEAPGSSISLVLSLNIGGLGMVAPGFSINTKSTRMVVPITADRKPYRCGARPPFFHQSSHRIFLACASCLY